MTGLDLPAFARFGIIRQAAERVTNERLPHVDGLLEMDAEAMAFQPRGLAGDPAAFAGRRGDAPVQRRRKLQGDGGTHQPRP